MIVIKNNGRRHGMTNGDLIIIFRQYRQHNKHSKTQNYKETKTLVVESNRRKINGFYEKNVIKKTMNGSKLTYAVTP